MTHFNYAEIQPSNIIMTDSLHYRIQNTVHTLNSFLRFNLTIMRNPPHHTHTHSQSVCLKVKVKSLTGFNPIMPCHPMPCHPLNSFIQRSTIHGTRSYNCSIMYGRVREVVLLLASCSELFLPLDFRQEAPNNLQLWHGIIAWTRLQILYTRNE